jgi:hypothetical protein
MEEQMSPRHIILFSVLAGCLGTSDGKLAVYENPPDLTIVSPVNDSEYNQGEVVNFEARISDDQDVPEDILLTWSSDIDGELLSSNSASSDGTIAFATANLTPGYTHTITLEAVDTDALSNAVTVSVNIIDLPEAPELSVVQPAAGQSGIEGDEFEFIALVSDSLDAPEDLILTISTDLDDGRFCASTPDATGKATCLYTLSPGVHQLTFTVTDSEAYETNSVIYFTVVAGTEIDDDEDGWTESQGDCDDTDPSINPSEPEVENGTDDNCDGIIDEGTDAYDDDNDGYTENQGDCDDSQSSINPGETEVCGNSVDENCNSNLNEEDAIDCDVYYRDYDGDGYGSASYDKCMCSGDGYYTSANDEDCYDYNASANPAQGGYFSVSRGDGNYDYNCDNLQTKNDTSVGKCSGAIWICTTSTTGWSGSSPSCGIAANYVTGCDAGFTSCSEKTSSQTQTCK